MNTKTIIVTGAASGIGKEIVSQCLKEEFTVIACDINKEPLEKLNSDLPDTDKLFTYPVDVSDYLQVLQFFENIEKDQFQLYALVNNAGVYLSQNLLEYTAEEIDKVLNINLKGSIYFSKIFGEKLLNLKQKGVIINMSSISAMEGSSDAIYGASKAAILGLTKSLATNFSPYIRANTVSPTMVETPMMKVIPDWRKKEYFNNQLIHDPVTSKDVAETVLFLLSDKSRHYTGASFDINNGGYLI